MKNLINLLNNSNNLVIPIKKTTHTFFNNDCKSIFNFNFLQKNENNNKDIQQET